MKATEKLMERDPAKSVVPFGDGTQQQFSHTDLKHLGDPTGISIQEGEFLYGLIRMLQPNICLETGTNIGVSTSYICQGLVDNGKGHITTIEHDRTVSAAARKKLSGMGFTNFTIFEGSEKDFSITEELDFLWLDTELKIRYAELLKYYPKMKPGAIACIHDLWTLDWSEFGGVPEEMQQMLKNGDLRALTFCTPHGVTVFQKRRAVDYLADLRK